MCGIAGLFVSENCRYHIEPALMWDIIEKVRHRGPDDMGVVMGDKTHHASISRSNGTVSFSSIWALAHARLSIIDLSDAGHQPMRSAHGNCWISYNGEVYNYIELREELRALGVEFHSGTDTEVVLEAYRIWGEECVGRFVGMFAFIIVDHDKQKVFLAVDRFGIKPLYLWSQQGLTAIVSEIKQLCSISPFAPRLNLQQAVDFIIDGVIHHDPDQCFFKDVHPLSPAHTLSWTLGKTPNIGDARPYWTPVVASQTIGWKEAVEGTRERFHEAVKLHLRSDVPVGSCLSGGVDSSAIVCVASQLLNRHMCTFSSCFDDKRIDEQYYIDAVNRDCGTDPVKIFVDDDELENDYERLIYHQDEPFTSLSVYAQYRLMKAAKGRGIAVLLDGQGADEILCGYRKYAFFYLKSLLSAGDVYSAVRHLGYLVMRGDGRQFALGAGRRYWPNYLRNNERQGAPFLQRKVRQYARLIWSARMKGVNSITEQRRADLCWWSLPGLLRYEDRNSMAHSVESRVPFLDHRLVEYLMSLPHEHFFKRGKTKRLLTDALSDVLSAEVRDRRTKFGFETPSNKWMRGRMGVYLEGVVKSSSSRFEHIIDKKALAKAIGDCRHGSRAFHDEKLFRLASFVRWGDVFNVEV